MDSSDYDGEKKKSNQYSGSKAARYAKNWAYGRNLKYRFYSSDCTNFVSQCLYAGGIPMSNKWKHKLKSGKWDVTLTWSVAPNSYSFFMNSKYSYGSLKIKDKYSTIADYIYNIRVGDPIYFDKGNGIYHAGIIVKVNTKKKKAYYAAHTTDRSCYNLGKFLKHEKDSKKCVYVVRMRKSW